MVELNAAQDSLTLSSGQNEDWTVVREELHRQATYMRQLEDANVKMIAELNILREKQTSVEVLKGHKRDLERKLRGAEELREQVVKLEAELEAARKERRTVRRATLCSITKRLNPFPIPHGVILRHTRHPIGDTRLGHNAFPIYDLRMHG